VTPTHEDRRDRQSERSTDDELSAADERLTKILISIQMKSDVVFNCFYILFISKRVLSDSCPSNGDQQKNFKKSNKRNQFIFNAIILEAKIIATPAKIFASKVITFILKALIRFVFLHITLCFIYTSKSQVLSVKSRSAEIKKIE